jgi:XRE family transcriptional regulator, aerobic/anaerobic benzoate catabolism transcriptional regulator
MATHVNPKALVAPLPPVSEAEFLSGVGNRVREIRSRRGMTRRIVARESDVSERHLAQLESGEGNISILLLRRVASALNVSLGELFSPATEEPNHKELAAQLLERLPAERREEVLRRLLREFDNGNDARRRRIALIGLRGAGKSTLGARLAKHSGVPFIELDKEIEKDAGMPLDEIFSLYGQAGYRRVEKRTLDRVLRNADRVVISVGGGVVSEKETYDRLLSSCYTVWVKARPEEHMARVIEQGDFRAMANNDQAMEDLRRILEAREPLYRKADLHFDNSGNSVEENFAKLKHALQFDGQ